MNSFKPQYQEYKATPGFMNSKSQDSTMDIIHKHEETPIQVKSSKIGLSESKSAAWKIPTNRLSHGHTTKKNVEKMDMIEEDERRCTRKVQVTHPLERSQNENGRDSRIVPERIVKNGRECQDYSEEALKILNTRRSNEIKKLDDFEKYEAIKKECPKLFAITNELIRSVRQLKYKYFPLLNSTQMQNLQSRKCLEKKFDLLLTYCTNLLLYINSKRGNNTTVKSKMSLKDIMDLKTQIAQLNETQEANVLTNPKPETKNVSEVVATQIPSQSNTQFHNLDILVPQIQQTAPITIKKEQMDIIYGNQRREEKAETKKKNVHPSKSIGNQCIRKRPQIDSASATKLSRTLPGEKARQSRSVIYHSTPNLAFGALEVMPFDRKYSTHSGYKYHEVDEEKRIGMNNRILNGSAILMEEEGSDENDILHVRIEDEFCRQMKKLKREQQFQHIKQKAKYSSHALLMEAEDLKNCSYT